jgi:hypothetical protein
MIIPQMKGIDTTAFTRLPAGQWRSVRRGHLGQGAIGRVKAAVAMRNLVRKNDLIRD